MKNNKCILVYGLSNIELEKIKELNHKLIEITPDMCEMTLNDILAGMKIESLNNNPIKEKVVIFNDFSENDIRENIKMVRMVVRDGIMAMVTPVSINWKADYLIKHLVEEREWYLKNRKE